MKKIIRLLSLVQLFLQGAGDLLKIKNGYVCFPFYSRLSVKIVSAIFSLAFLTPGFAQNAKPYHEQEIDVRKAYVYVQRGYEKTKKGDINAAIKLFDKSVMLNPYNYQSWLYRGIAKARLEHYNEALPDFNQVVKLYPRYVLGLFYRGMTKVYLEDYTGAIEDFDQVIALDSTHAQAYYDRGLAYERIGNRDSACIDYHKSASLGVAEAKKSADLCVNSFNTGIHTETLDTAGLFAMGIQSMLVGPDTAYGIIFMILPKPTDTLKSHIKSHVGLKQNPLATIDLQLKDGSTVQADIVLTGPDDSNDKHAAFMGLFNEDDKALMLEYGVEKINIYSGKKNYEYTIKDSYADKFKVLFNGNSPH